MEIQDICPFVANRGRTPPN